MTKQELVIKFYNEIIDTIRGAEEQGFTGNELFAILEHEATKTKDELLNKNI